MQSLAVVRTGLEAEQAKMDVISNNLANVNTTGFKRMRPVFSDLLYQDPTQAGGFTSQATNYPSGLQQGTGANVVATEPRSHRGAWSRPEMPSILRSTGRDIFRSCYRRVRLPIPVTAAFRSVRRGRSLMPRAISCSRRLLFRVTRKASRLGTTVPSAFRSSVRPSRRRSV